MNMQIINDHDPITLEKVQDIPKQRHLVISAKTHQNCCKNAQKNNNNNNTITAITAIANNNVSLQCCNKSSHYIFDSKALAEYILESYSLENPFDRTKFTREEILRMDIQNKINNLTSITISPIYDNCEQLKYAEMQRHQMMLYYKQKLLDTVQFICNFADFENHATHINFFKDYALSWVLYYENRMIVIGSKKSEMDMAMKEIVLLIQQKEQETRSNKQYLEFLKQPLKFSMVAVAMLLGKIKEEKEGGNEASKKRFESMTNFVNENYKKAWETIERVPTIFETFDIVQGTSIMHQLVFQNGKPQNPHVLFDLVHCFAPMNI